MPRPRLVVVVAALAGLAVGVCRAQEVKAPDATALPTDPRVVQGELPNGLRYMVQKHGNPEGRAVMWMHVSTGSLNETDPQRGIAHYLEHMAFNGSEHFPPGEVVKFFEGMGMTFGRDQNAFTSFEQTVYQLSLPDVKEETVRRGLTFFSDVGTGLLLLDKEIDNERQIILEEKTSRKNAQQRIMEKMITRVAPGSTFGERLPIGTDETIKSVKRSDFLDYYNRYYVLSNITLMVVADEEPAKIVESIKAVFGAKEARVATPADREVGVKAYTESFAVVATDPEMPRAQIAIAHLEPALGPSKTEADMRREMVDSLAGQVFNRRMENLKSSGEMVGQFIAAGTNQTANAFREAQIVSIGKPEQWRAMLTQIAGELMRAKQFGFSEAEVDQARKSVRSSLETQAKREDTAPAARVIGRLNSAVAAGESPMSAAQTLELADRMLPTITAEEVSSYFVREFNTDAVRFTLATGVDGAPTEAELLAAGKAALAEKVEKRAESAVAKTLMEQTPKAGVVSESAEHEASKVWSAWLSNGVRVHQRFMDEEKDSVSVSITLYGGGLRETAATRGLTEAALTAWGRQRATSKLGSSEIRDLMNGKRVNVGGGAGMEAIAMSVTGSPDDLETGLQLAHLLLTDPKIEATALADWKTLQKQAIEVAEKDPGAMFGKLLPEALFPEGEARVRPLTLEQVDAVTIEKAQAWLKELLATSPIEVAVVGDLPRERAVELVAKYLGSLPARDRVTETTLAAERKLARPSEAKTLRRDVTTTTDQGTVFVGFYGPDAWNEADARAMGLAGRVLSSRMIDEIREKAQLVYSIRAASSPGDVFPGFGVFSASSTTQPGKADALVAKIGEMFAEFAKDGPTEVEMGVAKLQIAKTFETSVRQQGYWMGALSDATFSRTNLDSVVKADVLAGAVTRDEVIAAFRKYYGDGKLITVEVRPTAK